MYYSDHMSGADWVAMATVMVFMLILVLVVVWVIVRWASPVDRSAPPQPEKSARDILDERYARGEIDKEEYEERRHTLDYRPSH